MVRKSVMAVSIAVVIASDTAVYIASIGGFDPSKRIMTDPVVEGREIRTGENPTQPPEALKNNNNNNTNAFAG
jgi:hypothetical protein